METKMIRVPFEVELAKKITEKYVDGRIVTRDGRSVRIVCWDRKCDEHPIIALIDNAEKGEGFGFYTTDGVTTYYNCTLDIMLEIPEYMTFKDGDVLTTFGMPFIFKGYKHNGCMYYAGVNAAGTLVLSLKEGVLWSMNKSDCRFSTEAEKQKLIDALKESKDQRAKEYLKRFFGIEEKNEYEFKPFDKVLVRCSDESQWCARFFDRMFKGNYACTDSLRYKQCIPYNEQTAHLLGTTEKYE